MTDPKDELEEWLRREPAPDVDYRALLDDVEKDIARAEKRPSFWLRSRPTWLRRILALFAVFALPAVVAVGWMRPDVGAHVTASVAALATLLVFAVFEALRPLHKPPLAGWARGAAMALTLIATFLIAAFPPHAEPGAWPPEVSPCLFLGLLAGIPMYGILRWLDRGNGVAPLLGACAAGLIGNLVLELHCPSHEIQHLMFGHFMVAVIFVGGLGLLHVLVRRR